MYAFVESSIKYIMLAFECFSRNCVGSDTSLAPSIINTIVSVIHCLRINFHELLLNLPILRDTSASSAVVRPARVMCLAISMYTHVLIYVYFRRYTRNTSPYLMIISIHASTYDTYTHIYIYIYACLHRYMHIYIYVGMLRETARLQR